MTTGMRDHTVVVMNVDILSCVHVEVEGGEECGKSQSSHYTGAPGIRRAALGHQFEAPVFPSEVDFEVWEIKDGKPVRKVSHGQSEQQARLIAETWTGETDAEDGVLNGFLAVRTATKRGVAVRIEDV